MGWYILRTGAINTGIYCEYRSDGRTGKGFGNPDPCPGSVEVEL